jgi:hypothetical protein
MRLYFTIYNKFCLNKEPKSELKLLKLMSSKRTVASISCTNYLHLTVVTSCLSTLTTYSTILELYQEVATPIVVVMIKIITVNKWHLGPLTYNHLQHLIKATAPPNKGRLSERGYIYFFCCFYLVCNGLIFIIH